MNYQLHYDNIIQKARNRILDGYTEQHHIVPRCLGGTDDSENLVRLTPEEHYVAHQLLVKIFPTEPKLLYAALMMTVTGKNHSVRSNKRYGWLKRRHSDVCKLRTGKNNTQYGTCWISHIEKRLTKKIPRNEFCDWEVAGWIRARIIDFDKVARCVICDKSTVSKRQTCGDKCYRVFRSRQRSTDNPLLGREAELLDLYKAHNGNLNRTLQDMGFPGNQSHWGRHAKDILSRISSAGRAAHS